MSVNIHYYYYYYLQLQVQIQVSWAGLVFSQRIHRKCDFGLRLRVTKTVTVRVSFSLKLTCIVSRFRLLVLEINRKKVGCLELREPFTIHELVRVKN